MALVAVCVAILTSDLLIAVIAEVRDDALRGRAVGVEYEWAWCEIFGEFAACRILTCGLISVDVDSHCVHF